MSLSHKELKRAYLAYNRKYFDGRLPTDADVMFAPLDGHHACVESLWENDMTLQIDTKHAIDSLLWRQSLLHECAHVSSGAWKHGAKFYAEIDRLYAAGAYRGLL